MAKEGQLVSPAAEIFKKANKIASIGDDGKLIASQIPEGISSTNKYEDYIKTSELVEGEIYNASLTLTTPSPGPTYPSSISISPAKTSGSFSSIDISCPQDESASSSPSYITITVNILMFQVQKVGML